MATFRNPTSTAVTNKTDVADDTISQMRQMYESMISQLRSVSPSTASVLVAVTGTTIGVGALSFKLGFKQPGLHALYALVASSIIGLLWIAQRHGPGHLLQTWRTVRRVGIAGAQETRKIDELNVTLNAIAQADLPIPRTLAPRQGVTCLLVPTALIPVSRPIGTNEDDLSGSIKAANFMIWNSTGTCSEWLWKQACAEFDAMCERWVLAVERKERPQEMPLILTACWDDKAGKHHIPKEEDVPMKMVPRSIVHDLSLHTLKDAAFMQAYTLVHVTVMFKLMQQMTNWAADGAPGYMGLIHGMVTPQAST